MSDFLKGFATVAGALIWGFVIAPLTIVCLIVAWVAVRDLLF